MSFFLCIRSFAQEIIWLKCYSLSTYKSNLFFFFLNFRIQEIKPKNLAYGSKLLLKALLSNFLAETGLRIQPLPALGNTDTAFQTAVILLIWELRHRNRKSVIFMKISKRLEAKTQLLPTP